MQPVHIGLKAQGVQALDEPLVQQVVADEGKDELFFCLWLHEVAVFMLQQQKYRVIFRLLDTYMCYFENKSEKKYNLDFGSNSLFLRQTKPTMIEKINRIQKWVETISTATLGVISGYFINEIIKETKFQEILLLALIVFVILIEKIFDWLLKTLIANSKALRKIIAGNHYIEGYWVERVVNINNPTQPYGFALIKISFYNMQYSVSGEIINKEMTDCISNFHSNYSDYNNFTLTYYFKAINVTDTLTNDIIGKGEFEFVAREKMPTRLRGSIIDTKNQSMLKLEAEKINSKIINKYEDITEKQVIDIVKEHLNSSTTQFV